MGTILVSIISDQTIPNLLIIKELAPQYDAQVFISTKKMEEAGKSFWIEKAAGIEPGTIQRIEVNENNWTDINEKLTNFIWPENAEYIVNLTGGTKVMTLAVYEFFSKPGNRIIYVPIGKNQYEELYPDQNTNEKPISYRLSLKEYFHAYGLYFTAEPDSIYSKKYTIHFFKEFRRNNFNFKRQAEILNAHQMTDKRDKAYCSGKWFEEFSKHLITTKLNIGSDAIALNLKLFRDPNSIGHDNEYDLVFTMDNSLYVIECKASLGNEKTMKAKIEKSLYKLGAITRDFGLRVNSYIFTLSDINILGSESVGMINRRKEILGIKEIFDARSFYNVNKVTNHFKP